MCFSNMSANYTVARKIVRISAAKERSHEFQVIKIVVLISADRSSKKRIIRFCRSNVFAPHFGTMPTNKTRLPALSPYQRIHKVRQEKR